MVSCGSSDVVNLVWFVGLMLSFSDDSFAADRGTVAAAINRSSIPASKGSAAIALTPLLTFKSVDDDAEVVREPVASATVVLPLEEDEEDGNCRLPATPSSVFIWSFLLLGAVRRR